MLIKSSNSNRFKYHLSNLQNNISNEDFISFKNLILNKIDHESKESIYLRICLNKLFNLNLKEYLEKSLKTIPILVNYFGENRKITIKIMRLKKRLN